MDVMDESISELLNSLVEVKGYKYPLSVCYSATLNLPNLDEINLLTGKHFRLPSKDELRFIISEASGVRDRLWWRWLIRLEVCRINGQDVLMDTDSGELVNEVYHAPMRGEQYWQPLERLYRLVETDVEIEDREDPEYDELLERKKRDQEIADWEDEQYAAWDH